jgi:4,5-dihydroxyphthalate decarboxylase
MAKLELTMACATYDRVKPIADGRVKIENVDLSFFDIDPEEGFKRAFQSHEFDITELSTSTHILTTARGDAHYMAIPIFTSRVFRHGAIYIRTDRGIKSPQDLRGKVVGVPEYQMTAALWARGVLSDEYGVQAKDMRWRNGGLHHPGRIERTPINLPPEIELEPIPAGKTLSDMLASGEHDAMITGRVPNCFTEGAPNVGRLFPNVREVEEAYYRKTEMFPIMHLISIRRSLVEQHPWLASSVVKAFMHAKRIAMHELTDYGCYFVMLPWHEDDVARAQAVMGADVWPYGIKANRKQIETMARWSVEQGLAKRLVTVEELFAPGTHVDMQLRD